MYASPCICVCLHQKPRWVVVTFLRSGCITQHPFFVLSFGPNLRLYVYSHSSSFVCCSSCATLVLISLYVYLCVILTFKSISDESVHEFLLYLKQVKTKKIIFTKILCAVTDIMWQEIDKKQNSFFSEFLFNFEFSIYYFTNLFLIKIVFLKSNYYDLRNIQYSSHINILIVIRVKTHYLSLKKHLTISTSQFCVCYTFL